MVTVNCPEAVCVTVAPLNLILLTLLTEVVPSVTVNAVPPPPVVPEIMVVPPYKLIYQSSWPLPPASSSIKIDNWFEL